MTDWIEEGLLKFIGALLDWQTDLNYARRHHPIGFWLLLPVWVPIYTVWLACCIARDIAA